MGMDLGMRVARELEEWQRLGLVLDRGGTRALVDDWQMGEAYGLSPIIAGRQLLDWLRTQLTPADMADIDRLEGILYIRNTQRLRSVIVQESLAQTGRGGPVNLRALRWAEFIYNQDPSTVGRAIVDGHWARQVFWRSPQTSPNETVPGNHQALARFLAQTWEQAWRARKDEQTAGLGLVALWSLIRKRMERHEARFLWEACLQWEALIPDVVAQDVRRAAVSGQTRAQDREETRTRM